MKRSSPRICRAWLAAVAAPVGGESGDQVLEWSAGRVGGGEQAGGVGEALAGRGEHAEQLDAVAGVHPVAAAMPLRGGLAGQVLGVGELAPVPGHDALSVAQRGGGDGLVAPAQLSARLADGGSRRGLVTGTGGQAGQAGQGGGNEHDHLGTAPAVGGPAQRADGGSDIVPGGGEARFSQRSEDFHPPDGILSRGPAQSDLGFGRVELAHGGEQPCPQMAHHHLGKAVRVRRRQVRGLVERGYGGRLDAQSSDRAH